MATSIMMAHIWLLQPSLETKEASSISSTIEEDLSRPKNGALGPYNDWPNDQGVYLGYSNTRKDSSADGLSSSMSYMSSVLRWNLG